MRTLVIDTATKACSVALFDDSECIGARHEIMGRGHAEKLISYIAALPDRGKADRIVVDVGPGSFTGIRVGISAAKALALAWGAECFGYDCLSLVAAIAREDAGGAQPIDVMMTGGHGEYFFAAFDRAGRMTAPFMSLPIGDIMDRSAASIIAGDAASQIQQFRTDGTVIEIYPDARQWPLIADLAPLPASAAYGRPPDAKIAAKP